MSVIKPETYDGNEPYIFVSYSHKDNTAVWKLIRQLQSRGYRIWYDDDIHPGKEWDVVIENRLENCSFFLCFITVNYWGSRNCLDELKYAVDLDRNMALAYLEECDIPAGTGLRMRIGRKQNLHRANFNSDQDFLEKLCSTDSILLANKQQNIVHIVFENNDNESKVHYDEKYSHPLKRGDQVFIGHAIAGLKTKEGSPISWKVLKCSNNSAILISDDILAEMPFHNINKSTSDWENCSLRKWLNEDFYNNVFSISEKAYIVQRKNISKNNPKYKTPAGNDTADHVFLLDVAEFSSYGVKEIADISQKDENMSWWLRTPGFSQNFAANVGWRVHYGGLHIDEERVGVRPAIQIRI